jgi:hypothetical protein
MNRQININPCFSIYFSSRNTEKPTELAEEHLPVHNKTNIKLNSCTYLCCRCVTCKISTANLTHQHCLSRAVLTASGWKQRLVVCVMSVTEWFASNVVTRTLICTYKLRTASHILPPLRIAVSRNPWHPFAERWGSEEPRLRNTD